MKVRDTLTDKDLERLWRDTDWDVAEIELRNLQRGIALAAIKRDVVSLTRAQKRLVRSIYAKSLAVRHVCDATAQAGIDNIKWETDADKMRAALSLDSKGYIAKPMRLLIVRPRGQTKDRHIQIPTFYDRAMQTLYAYSLDPVSESVGERKSFAFRKGRSMFDVHAYIVKALETENPPRYIVKADVRACYASISHEWLLKNIPMDSRVLRQFLKAGHVFGGEIFPPDDFGISLGSSISPILGNMTLDGAQQAIFDGLHDGNVDIDYADGNLIRFADDIIVTARTRESATEIIKILGSFFAVRGLTLSEQKTRIIDLSDGFDFLSRHYQYSDGYVYATPSEGAVAKIEKTLRELITPYRGGQKALIDKINKKLVGWASYHKITEAGQVFRHIDHVIKTLLLELCERLNPRLSRERIISKYFYREPDGEYVYALENKPDVRVRRISETVLITHQPVSTKKNPYLDDDYYEERTDERAISTVTGKYKPVWARQGGKCFYCGRPILSDEKRCVVTIDPSRPHHPKNLAYVHEYCSLGQAEFYDSDFDIDNRFDLYELLIRMNEGKQQPVKKRKFDSLTEHFRKYNEAVFTLSFKDIENIIGEPLCESARKRREYWYRRGEKNISFCWQSNGYKIRNLNLTDARIVFERESDKGDAVNIPTVFLSGRIPSAARAELEILFEFVKNKYGL